MTVRRRPVVVLALLAVAGCGSTVQIKGTAQIGGTLSDGLTPLPNATTGALPLGPGVDPRGGLVAVPGPGGTAPPTRGGVGVPSPAALAPGRSGHGYTATTITLGYSTAKNAQATLGALGIAASSGDVDNQMRALAADVNARGGIAGRRIQYVPHDFDVAGCNTDPASCNQSACEDWTVDHKVFAVIDGVGTMGDPSVGACLAKAGTPIMTDWFLTAGSEAYRNPTGLYSPSAMPIERYLAALVDRLVAQGFFGKWDILNGRPGTAAVRIGVTYFEEPRDRLYVKVLGQALAKHGLEIAEARSHGRALADNSASTKADVLRFQSSGITHVFHANLFFYQNAQSQGYHPRYAVDDTISTPALLATLVSADQLRGSMGAGYLPTTEVPNPPDPSPATGRCRKLMRAAGEDTSDAIAFAVMLNECDAINLLVEATSLAGGLSLDALHRGTGLLGKAFEPALTYRTSFTGTDHAGAGVVRDFRYNEPCGCFAFPDAKLHPA